jgi:hypothetical protein
LLANHADTAYVASHRHFTAAKRDLASISGDDARAVERWLVTLQHAAKERNVAKVLQLQVVADKKASKLEDAATRSRQRDWRQALARSEPRAPDAAPGATPSKLAFKWVKGINGWGPSPKGKVADEQGLPDEEVDDLPFDDDMVPTASNSMASIPSQSQPLSDQGAVEKVANGWAGWWAEDTDYALSPGALADVPDLPALRDHAMIEAAKSFPIDTGVGMENWAPRAHTRLPAAAITMLGAILMAAERLGVWTKALGLVMIILLPKSDGGLRPIGLFPSMIRVWMRTRLFVVRSWEAATALPCLFGAVGKGAQRAAWTIAFSSETAVLTGFDHAASLLDIAKAFEALPHELIVEAARKHGYHLGILRLTLAAYRIARSIGVNGIFSRLVVASRGITAGSGFATSELRLLFLDLVINISRFWPLVQTVLYVDDLTIAARGAHGMAQRLVAQATEYAIRYFEIKLRLKVSESKSIAIASKRSIARGAIRRMTNRLLHVRTSDKLLGAPYGGGRRRCVGTVKKRFKTFRLQTSKIRALRKAGVSARKYVKTAGLPTMLYGVDVCGLSDSMLLESRRAAVAALAPPNAGKNPDLALYALDAVGSHIDPAFDAHILPLKQWATAWWESWIDHAILFQAWEAAERRLHERSSSVWRKVTGPVAATIATAQRLGWKLIDGRVFVDDAGQSFDCLLDSPAAITAAITRSVRRWQINRVARELPSGRPLFCDLSSPSADDGATILLDTRVALSRVLKGTTAVRKVVEEWQPTCAAHLISGVSGGQWTQARRAQVPSFNVSDSRCQLCFAELGTLPHRRRCQSTLPPGGWSVRPRLVAQFMDQLSESRRETLQTRGFLALSVPIPPEQQETGLVWILGPPDFTDSSLVWYIDGSRKYGSTWITARTGCGFVVIDTRGSLIAAGWATPPSWIRTSGAAEAWALLLVLSSVPCPPRIVTDYKGILTEVECGTVRATAARRPLARIWKQISISLDGKIEVLATADRIVWMLAHKSIWDIDGLRRSDGLMVSTLDWRANRLADALAKMGAPVSSMAQSIVRLFSTACEAAQYECALLGVVTNAANNCKTVITLADGTSKTIIKRDAVGARAARSSSLPQRLSGKRTKGRARTEFLVDSALPVDDVQEPGSNRPALVAARMRARRAATQRRKSAESAITLDIVNRRAAVARPSSEPPAAVRFENLRRRIQLKAT